MTEFNAEKCFEIYRGRYQELLHKYYPAHRSAGFTERNQAVNFAQAVYTVYPSSFAWFEAALNTKPEQHMDAVIFVPELNSTLLVESKRFSTPHSKLKEVAEDIKRLCDRNNHQTICAELKGEFQKCAQNILGIILADVWLETEIKNDIYKFWGEGFFEKSKDLYPVSADVLDKQENIKWCKSNKGDFGDLKYALLALMFQIKLPM